MKFKYGLMIKNKEESDGRVWILLWQRHNIPRDNWKYISGLKYFYLYTSHKNAQFFKKNTFLIVGPVNFDDILKLKCTKMFNVE